MIFKKRFPDYFFLYLITVIAVVVSAISYYHFIIKQDYIVWYEGSCDPTTEKCFVGCSDDACTEEYYYSKVQKYAPDLYKECGKDITDCANANVCLISDRGCYIVYCNVEVDGDVCKFLDSNTEDTSEINQSDSVDSILQNNTI
jgi:hypothetical protein